MSTARFLLFALVVVVGIKLSEQAYRLVAYRDERARVATLRERLLDAGAQYTVRRAELKALRAELEAEDRSLEAEHRALSRYVREVRAGPVSAERYAEYTEALEAYNRHVVARNQRFLRYRDVAEGQEQVAERYNVLADSIRDLAARMGEPYYSVPTPLEAAVQRGVLAPPAP